MAQKVKVWNATPSYISASEGIIRPAETAIVEKDAKISEMLSDGRLVLVQDELADKKQKKKSQTEEEVAISQEITQESVEENIDVPEEFKLPDEG